MSYYLCMELYRGDLRYIYGNGYIYIVNVINMINHEEKNIRYHSFYLKI